MTKEEFIEQKKQKIGLLQVRAKKNMEEINAIANLPVPETIWETFERSSRIVQLATECRSLYMQMSLIEAQPYPKFPPGEFSGIAQVGETGEDTITARDGFSIKISKN